MSTLNQAMYHDLLWRSQDVYAGTKDDILLEYLARHSALRILNVGCGTGELSLRLAARGHRVHGIDLEAEHVKLAQRHGGVGGPGLATFEVAAIEDYRGAGDFDCVLSTDVLEHIEDDRAALARMVSLVRPRGLVLLTVPAGQWLFGYHDEAMGHFRRYTRTSLRRLVGEFCDVETMRYFGFSLIPLCLAFSKVLRRPYPVAQTCGESRRSVLGGALRGLLWLDRRLPMPLGTSLILKGTRKPAHPQRAAA